eukprot:scaffold6587_cov103-Isochrysis_galbana.AAC.3
MQSVGWRGCIDDVDHVHHPDNVPVSQLPEHVHLTPQPGKPGDSMAGCAGAAHPGTEGGAAAEGEHCPDGVPCGAGGVKPAPLTTRYRAWV